MTNLTRKKVVADVKLNQHLRSIRRQKERGLLTEIEYSTSKMNALLKHTRELKNIERAGK